MTIVSDDESSSTNSAENPITSDLTAIRRTLFGIWVIGLCALVWFGILSVQLSTMHHDIKCVVPTGAQR